MYTHTHTFTKHTFTHSQNTHSHRHSHTHSHTYSADNPVSIVPEFPYTRLHSLVSQVCHVVSGRVVGVNAEQETRPQHPDAANDDDSVDDRGRVTDKPKDSVTIK